MVRIHTVYWLDGPGFDSRWRRDFLDQSRRVSWPTQLPVQGVPRLFRWRKAARRGAEYSPVSRAEVEESVELHVYPPLPARRLFDTLRHNFTVTNYVSLRHFICEIFLCTHFHQTPWIHLFTLVWETTFIYTNFDVKLHSNLTWRKDLSFIYIKRHKGKAIPLQAWTGPEGSRRSRLPDLKTFDIWIW